MSPSGVRAGWTSKPLAEVAEIEREAVQPTEIFSGTKYVGLEHIEGTGEIPVAPAVDSGDLASTKFRFTRKHVLYGKLRPYLRKIARPCFEGVCSTDILPIRPGVEIDRGYLFHFLRQPAMVSLATTRSAGANLPRLSPKVLAEFRIDYPSLPEQRRIAAILDKADAIRQKRQESIRLTEEFLRSAFLEMFGDPVANPRSWPTLDLGGVAPGAGAIVDGPFGSSLKPGCYVDAGVPVVRNFNINDDWFDDSAFKFVTAEKFEEIRRSEVLAGDVLLSTKGTIGNVCLMPDLGRPAVLSASGTVRLRLPKGGGLLGEFLVAQMSFPTWKRYCKSFEAGSNQKYLNLTGIRKMRVLAPPLDVQRAFVEMKKRVKAVGCRLSASEFDLRKLGEVLSLEAFSGGIRMRANS